MNKVVILMLIVLITGLAACNPQSEGPSNETGETVQAKGATLTSEVHRAVSPVVPEADKSSLVDGNSAFAFDLYQQLKEREGNLFFSPYSISAALAMTYAGARGETEKQMAKALSFELFQHDLHPAFNWLEEELAKRGEGAEGKDEKGFRLNVVNAIWGQKDYRFLVSYLDTLAVNYGAGLRILDFASDPEKSRVTINDWVGEQTEERIKNLIPSGAIDTMTRLVLTNAIYFNAAWASQFDKDNTTDGIFHLLEDGTVTVPMMKQRVRMMHDQGSNYHAVEMAYDGHELSMVILLPDEGSFSKFEDSLNSDKVVDIIERLKSTDVMLTMPKFEYESSFSLVEALSAMGMPLAFTPSADFSGITGNTELFIGEAVHKAFVSVDENGTEAAAATAVIMPASAPVKEPVTVTIDRPFIFFIRDIQTGTILFIGRVLAPS